MTNAKSQAPTIPLPRTWPESVKSAVLHVISLAQFAAAHTRGWAANSVNARVRLKAENDRLQQEVQLLREEIRIKDARMEQVPASRRPHYPPVRAHGHPGTQGGARAGRWSRRRKRSSSPPLPLPPGSSGLTRRAPQPSCNCRHRRSTSSRNSSATSCGGSKRSVPSMGKVKIAADARPRRPAPGHDHRGTHAQGRRRRRGTDSDSDRRSRARCRHEPRSRVRQRQDRRRPTPPPTAKAAWSRPSGPITSGTSI